MNLPTSIHQVIAHFIPGFIFLLILYVCQNHFCFYCLLGWINNLKDHTIIGFIGIGLSLSVGLFFDAIRTILHEWHDCLMDKCCTKNKETKKMQNVWDFLVRLDKNSIDIFEQYYYGYFVFECNMCIALIAGVAVECYYKGWIWMFCTIGIFLVLLIDVCLHKKHMLDFVQKREKI